jgi:hypothetical protein
VAAPAVPVVRQRSGSVGCAMRRTVRPPEHGPRPVARLGAEAGLDAGEAREVLAGDRYADEVRADERQARAFDISGVPFFVIDRRYGVSGAQQAGALLEVLETAWAQSHPLTVLTPAGGGSADGGACADGSCAV